VNSLGTSEAEISTVSGNRIEVHDWRAYWIDVHMVGLAKWVFPVLEDKL
jgi:hypothetical protein